MAERRQRDRDRKPRDFKGRDKKSQDFKARDRKPRVEEETVVTAPQEEVSGEMIAGKNPVLEALRAGREINKLWIADGVKKQVYKSL